MNNIAKKFTILNISRVVSGHNKENLRIIQYESMADQDYLYALRLQQELDELENVSI